jgi:hypothetical protein
MSPFLGLDAVAARRGDGLRPELRRLMIHHGLAAGEEIRKGDMLPDEPFLTDAPDLIEPQSIPVPGL